MTVPKLETHRSNMRGNTIAIFLAAAFMLVVMVGSIYYPFPSGEPMTIGGFIKLWFREVIALVFLIVVLIAVAISWLRRTLNARRNGNQNAL